MPDLITKLTLENRDFNENLNSSTRAVDEFNKKTEDASKSVEDLANKGGKSAKELLKEMNGLDQSVRSVSNYRKQLTQITRDIQDLSINYANMTKEMKNSDIGNEVFLKIRELTAEASKYKDAISDAQQSITALASDTAAWDSMKQGISMVSSAMSAFVASGVLGEQTTEKMVAVLTKLKAIEAATNAVIQVGNALQKQSALMMGISRIQSAALAKAKLAEAAATGTATAAQKIFNKVAMANPYVLLATALIAVGTALAAFAIKADKAKQEQERLKKAHEDYMQAVEGQSDAIADASFKYDQLAKKYRDCRTEAEKQDFLDKYKTKLQELGIQVNDINGLEDVFIKRTAEFRRACQIRAQALAIDSQIADEYKEFTKSLFEAEDILASIKPGDRIDEGSKAFDILKEYGGYTTYVNRWGKDYVIAADNAFDVVQKAMEDGFKKTRDKWDKQQEKLLDELDDLDLGDAFSYDDITNKNNSTTNKTLNDTNKLIVNQIELLKQEKKKLEEAKSGIEYGTKEWYENLEAINKVDKEIKKLEDDVQAYIDRLNSVPMQLPKMEDVLKLPQAETKSTLAPVVTFNPEQLAESYSVALQTAAKISDWNRMGIISNEKAVEMIKTINENLKNQGIKVPVHLDGSNLADELSDFASVLNSGQGAMSSFVGGFESMYTSITKLNETLSDSTSGIEQLFAVFNTGMSILQSVSNIIDAVSAATTLFNSIKAAGIPLLQSDTNATRENARAHIKAAGAKGAEAAAEAGKSVASIPYVGAALAAAAIISTIALIASTISKAKGFSKGGVANFPSMAGDKNLIRVNGGEMILNRRQQSNLFKMLDEGKTTNASNASGLGEVEFKIRGSDLVGTLKNYNNKINKI